MRQALLSYIFSSFLFFLIAFELFLSSKSMFILQLYSSQMALAWLLAMVVMMAYDPFNMGGGGKGGLSGAGGSDGGKLPPDCLSGDSMGPCASLCIMMTGRICHGGGLMPLCWVQGCSDLDIEPAWLIMEPVTHLFFD